MSLRESISVALGPGLLPGIRFGDWLRLLADNRFAVTPSCLVRAASISYCSMTTSLIGLYERLRCDARVKDCEVKAPLFVLGHWRQGTTHLHNLFATDERFGCPTLYQVLNPHTFLATESTWVARAIALGVPETRPMDNMALGIDLPFEDEYALSACGRYSPYLGFAFPRRREHYDRYLTLRDVPQDEVDEWKRQLLWFLKKLTLRHQRPLVLKSPTHTSRIRVLLDLFPDARFVHVRRHPYDVFRSTQRQVAVALRWYRLQKSVSEEAIDDWIIERFRRMYESYFRERTFIPPGRICEVAYEQLENDAFAEMKRVYSELQLPVFEQTAAELKAYVASLKGYRKNRFPELPAPMKERLKREWQQAFSEWGYSLNR